MIPPRTLLAGVLLTGALVGGPARAAGDLTEVTVLQSFEPVRGVRLIEVRGTAAGKDRQLWLMIEDREFLRLTDCGHQDGVRSAPGLSYSERSRRVSVVTCAR